MLNKPHKEFKVVVLISGGQDYLHHRVGLTTHI